MDVERTINAACAACCRAAHRARLKQHDTVAGLYVLIEGRKRWCVNQPCKAPCQCEHRYEAMPTWR